MFFYWTVWVILLLFVLHGRKLSIGAQNKCLGIIIVIIAVLVGCRIDVGADWSNYVDGYYESVKPLDYFREPIFLLCEKCLCSVGLPYTYFFFSMAMIQMLCLKKAFILFDIKNLFLPFFLFFSIFFCMTTLNVVRHGIMIALIWLALGYLYKGKEKGYYIILLIAAGFHFMSLFFIPLNFVIRKKFNKALVIMIVAAGFAAMLMGLSLMLFNWFPYIAFLESRTTLYINENYLSETTGLTMGQLFDVTLCLFVYFKYHEKYKSDERIRICVNSLLFAFIVNSTLYAYGIFIERINQIFKFSLIFIFPIVLEYFSEYRTKQALKQVVTLAIVCYGFLYMNKAIHVPDPAENKVYQFQPYKIELANYFRHDQQR